MAVDTSDLERLAREAETLARRTPAAAGVVEHRNAQELQREAQSRAPVFEGHLRAGIIVQGSTVVSTDEAGPYVEYGTAFADAQPHMNPAADRQQPKFLRDAERAAVQLLERGL